MANAEGGQCSQKLHLWSCANPVSTVGAGAASDSTAGNAAHAVPVRANPVHNPTIASDRRSCAGSSVVGNSDRSPKRYASSDACAAPYGKLTGGRNGSGAFPSLNSYAYVGTYCDTSW